MAPGLGSSRRRLDSWKDVSGYLARDVRTVMRWASTDGLPVHHIGGSRHRAVFAWSDEIDAWLEAQPAAYRRSPASQETTGGHDGRLGVSRGTSAADVITTDRSALPSAAAPPEPRRLWWWAGVGSVVLAGLAWLWWSAAKAPAQRSIVSATSVQSRVLALDASGEEVWHYDVPAAGRDVTIRRVRVADVDGDGLADVVAAINLGGAAGDGAGVLMLFDASGVLRWTQALNDRYTYGDMTYAPGWFPDDVLVVGGEDEARIAVAWHHHTWWPSVVTLFDRHGRVVGRFVNAGWIHCLNLTADGRTLLASGVSNAFGGAMLAVLDLARIDGTSPADGGTLPPCSNCPDGDSLRYLVVPWSDVARRLDLAPVTVQVADSGEIELHALQRAESDLGMPELIVELSPAFDVRRRDVSDSFAREHRRMETLGILTHPFERCPWRRPPVRVWSRSGGWQLLQ